MSRQVATLQFFLGWQWRFT